MSSPPSYIELPLFSCVSVESFPLHVIGPAGLETWLSRFVLIFLLSGCVLIYLTQCLGAAFCFIFFFIFISGFHIFFFQVSDFILIL